MTIFLIRILGALSAVAFALGASDALAKGVTMRASRPAATVGKTTPVKPKADQETPINVPIPSVRSSPGSSGPTGAGAMPAALSTSAASSYNSPEKARPPSDDLEAVRASIERREAELNEQAAERARQREQDQKMIAIAEKQRQEAAAAEAARRAKRQKVVLTQPPACQIKPVMSEAEIAACRRR